MEKFVFGSFVYSYELIKQKRKTLSLTVTPELKIILKCPIEATPERIETFLKRKWFWLEKQFSFFKKYQKKTHKRDYVSGEACLYLGRQYRLLVKHAGKSHVTLTRGKLIVNTQQPIENSNYNKKLVDEWYYNKTAKVFAERIAQINDRFGYKQSPALIIMKMDKRWGSFLKSNKIILNPKLIFVSKDCIDYVITHEFCHSKYKKHDKNFFNLLEKKYPNWQKTKEKLEIMGSMIS